MTWPTAATRRRTAPASIEAYSATGSPLTFTLKIKGANGSDGVLGAKNKNEWLHSDGKGIDHLFDAYGGAIIGSFESCGVTPPF